MIYKEEIELNIKNIKDNYNLLRRVV